MKQPARRKPQAGSLRPHSEGTPHMTFKPIDPDLISREAAAATVGWSSDKLDYETARGRAPSPYRFNPRCVMYSRREIDEFIAKRDAEAKAEADAKAAAAAAKAERAEEAKARRQAAAKPWRRYGRPTKCSSPPG
jgi:predicted DNA-binding transcriptional regulator AlpA